MGQTALLLLRRKACWGFFSPWKIQRLRSRLNPRTWVPKASTLPLDHRSRPSTFLSIFFSKILSPHSSLKVRDQITYPHKTTGKIILLYTSVPVLLDCKWEEKDLGSKGGEHFPDLISSLFLHAYNFSLLVSFQNNRTSPHFLGFIAHLHVATVHYILLTAR